MARIRSIKPDFWTDEVIVQIPFEARLLFIGLWNFADDHGGLQDSADRIRLQVFPGDSGLDVDDLIELLIVAGLVDRYINEDGKQALRIKNWDKHQRVDNPGKTRVITESYRKLAIPSEARRGLAMKYGCQPGEKKDVTCFFCGMPGRIHWHRLSSGKPSAWVTFAGMEIDHGKPEAEGGTNGAENLVLSCRSCNRSRGRKDAFSYMSRGLLSSAIEDATEIIEASPSPRGSSLRKGKEGSVGNIPLTESKASKPRSTAKSAAAKSPIPEDFDLNDERRTYAEKHLPDVNAIALMETFRSTSKAKGWQYVDWDQHWQTLVRQWAPNSGHWSSGQYPRRSGVTANGGKSPYANAI